MLFLLCACIPIINKQILTQPLPAGGGGARLHRRGFDRGVPRPPPPPAGGGAGAAPGGWVGGWMWVFSEKGWMDGWMDGWVGGWVGSGVLLLLRGREGRGLFVGACFCVSGLCPCLWCRLVRNARRAPDLTLNTNDRHDNRLTASPAAAAAAAPMPPPLRPPPRPAMRWMWGRGPRGARRRRGGLGGR